MADEGFSEDEKRNKKFERKTQQLDIEARERRVHIAELHAREAEAEVRYLQAAAKRKALKAAKMDEATARRKKGKGRAGGGGS
jgi:hypothetical protein